MIKFLPALLIVAAASPAVGQTVTSRDPQSVVRALQESGYRAELKTEDDGSAYILSSSGGAKFSVIFYDCEKQKDCKTLQFYAGWSDKVTPAQMNEWNRDHRFGRGYIDEDGDANVEYDLDLEGGPLSTGTFRSTLETWASVMGAFEKFVGEASKPAKK